MTRMTLRSLLDDAEEYPLALRIAGWALSRYSFAELQAELAKLPYPDPLKVAVLNHFRDLERTGIDPKLTERV